MLPADADLVVVFGGMTIWFQNPAFIMWKPTLLYWLFAAILLVGRFKGTNYMKVLFAQLTMPEHVWANLEKAWFVFFLMILVRCALARVRTDQILNIGWKVFMPLSVFNLVVVVLLKVGGVF